MSGGLKETCSVVRQIHNHLGLGKMETKTIYTAVSERCKSQHLWCHERKWVKEPSTHRGLYWHFRERCAAIKATSLLYLSRTMWGLILHVLQQCGSMGVHVLDCPACSPGLSTKLKMHGTHKDTHPFPGARLYLPYHGVNIHVYSQQTNKYFFRIFFFCTFITNFKVC